MSELSCNIHGGEYIWNLKSINDERVWACVLCLASSIEDPYGADILEATRAQEILDKINRENFQ